MRVKYNESALSLDRSGNMHFHYALTFLASRTLTLVTPCCRSSLAARRPATPPPMITTSQSNCDEDDLLWGFEFMWWVEGVLVCFCTVFDGVVGLGVGMGACGGGVGVSDLSACVEVVVSVVGGGGVRFDGLLCIGFEGV